ncbi:lipoyltransferase 1, mitochondrial-like [Ruditapes philippinarum]|uniref:lipoyltransferase 1, mitochondrial-like n=1 Tax=Ruditapes philippinarum TaxID=129788 RepID=UPI00295A5B9E|nr:lipoyltransferase 1, mitochondrial-like [Ruditapes philippinarum]XP_060607009.1 lipoyltransferase 1, mitochondrial-like [Ruditapes philippinarum]
MGMLRRSWQILMPKYRLGNMMYRLCSSKAHRSHRVIISSSTNIYENLALEDWLFENTDFQNESVLLLWRNKPCVVFGRHQNPWVECNVPYCEKHEVDLVRRKSGGGTVYHDEGNLNCSFLMESSLYNRRRNLQLVVDAIKSQWNIPIAINNRDDLMFQDNYKISGTASKLGGKKTYHHFTLLYNVDKQRLKSILNSNLEGISSKATASLKMSVTNLADHFPDVDYTSLVDVISEHFVHNNQTKRIQSVNPLDENLFDGVEKHLAELKSWEWIFGKTPPFSIERTFYSKRNNMNVLNVNVDVTKGRIHNLKLEELNILNNTKVGRSFLTLRIGLEETKLCPNEVRKNLSDVKMEWIAQQVYTVQTHEYLDWVLQCVMETFAIFSERREP